MPATTPGCTAWHSTRPTPDYATETAATSLVGYSPTPSGREIDGELSYSTRLGGGWLGGNLFVRKDPGHVAAAEDDVGAAIRYTLGF